MRSIAFLTGVFWIASLAYLQASAGRLSSEKVDDVDHWGSVAPDGTYLVYTDWDNGNLALLDLRTKQRRLLTDEEGYQGFALFTAVSPDSLRIAFGWYQNGCALRLVNSDGSGARTLFSDPQVHEVVSLAFSPDGSRIAAVLVGKNRSFFRAVLISVSDGPAIDVSIRHQVTGNFAFSPDGDYLTYSAQIETPSTANEIRLLGLETRKIVSSIPCLSTCKPAGWTQTGDALIYVDYREDQPEFWRQSIRNGFPVGEAVPTGAKIDSKHLSGGLNLLGCTSGGDCYYGADTWTNGVYLAQVEWPAGRLSQIEKVVDKVGYDTSAHFSPGGESLSYAFGHDRVTDSMVVGIRSLRTGTERRFPVAMRRLGGHAFQPRWSSDGRFLLSQGRDLKMHQGLFQVNVPTGEVSPLVSAQETGILAGYVEWASASSEGIVFFGRWEAGGPRRIVRQDPAEESEVEIYRCDSDAKVSHIEASPDSKYLAFVETDFSTQMYVLKVLPLESGQAIERARLGPVSLSSYGQAVFAMAWTPDSDWILYIPPDEKESNLELWRIPAKEGEGESLGKLTVAPRAFGLSVHPDGHQIAFTAGTQDHGEVWVMRGIAAPEGMPRVP